MKAIFLCQSKQNVARVYGDVAIAKIESNYSLDRNVYGVNDLDLRDFSDVDVIFSTWGMPALTEKQIEKNFPCLKAVFYSAGSVQAFARPFLERGIRVFSAWIANALPVVEYAVSQILLANKGFYSLIRKTRKDYKGASEYFKNYKGNFDAKVGVLGDGAIGSRVIDRLLSYDLDVHVYSITMTKEQAGQKGVTLATLDEIFQECDVISNHLASNALTKGIINRKLLESMKDYSTFINTGRGAQVDEQALIDVLSKNPTITAVLDVTVPEPPVDGSPLYALDNVFLTPHIAGSAGDEVKRMAEFMAEESEMLACGQQTRYEVTLKMLETMA